MFFFTKEEIVELGEIIRSLDSEVKKKEEEIREIKSFGGNDYISLLEANLDISKETLHAYERILRVVEQKNPQEISVMKGTIGWQTSFLAKIGSGNEKMYVISNMPGEINGITRVPEGCPLGKAIMGKSVGEHKVKFGKNETIVDILNIF
jgi:hypothetical protein